MREVLGVGTCEGALVNGLYMKRNARTMASDRIRETSLQDRRFADLRPVLSNTVAITGFP